VQQRNARACVPGYQQTIQGNANLNVLRRIWQEVYWTDSDGEAKTDQKNWADEWKDNKATRAVDSETKPIDLDKAWNRDENNIKSFTMHLFDSDNTNTPLGGSYSPLNHQLTSKSGVNRETDIGRVVAAVNFMDNEKYGYNNFNAYCTKDVTGAPSKTHLWGNYYKTGGCNVEFDNSVAAAKMKRGEKPTPEEMFNITSKLEPDYTS
jgi:hypothetical protein